MDEEILDEKDVLIIDSSPVSDMSESEIGASGNFSVIFDGRNVNVKQTTESPKRKNKTVNLMSTSVSDPSLESTPKKIKGHKSSAAGKQTKEKPLEGCSDNKNHPGKNEQILFNPPDGHSQDSGLKTSLLEEVLAEKKMSLLRSPEVVSFLQARQAQILKDKSICSSKSYSQSDESMES